MKKAQGKFKLNQMETVGSSGAVPEIVDGARVAWVDTMSKLVLHGIVYKCEGSCLHECRDGTQLVHVIPFLEKDDLRPNAKYATMVNSKRLLDPVIHPQDYDYKQLYGKTPFEVIMEQSDDFDTEAQRIVDDVVRYGAPRNTHSDE